MTNAESDKADILRKRGLNKLDGYKQGSGALCITDSVNHSKRGLTDEAKMLANLVCFMLEIVRGTHPEQKLVFIEVGGIAEVTCVLDDVGQYWICNGFVDLKPDGFVESTTLQPLAQF